MLAGAQDVERECGAACASLAMPMPLNVSLRAEDLLQLQRHLLQLLQQLEPPVPFTPSLKVSKPFLNPRTALLWLSFINVQCCRSVENAMSSQPGCALSRWNRMRVCQMPEGSCLIYILLYRVSYVLVASKSVF